MNFRTGFAIAWMLLCAGLCVYLALGHDNLTLWAICGACALAFAFSAAGLALRWRWTEGFSYGLTLLCIVVCVVRTAAALGEYFEFYDHLDIKLIAVLSVILLSIITMLWYADSVRRRFSA